MSTSTTEVLQKFALPPHTTIETACAHPRPNPAASNQIESSANAYRRVHDSRMIKLWNQPSTSWSPSLVKSKGAIVGFIGYIVFE